MPRWSQDIVEQVVWDLSFSLRRKRGRLLRDATDLEIEVLARTIVERLQQANWLIERGPPAPMGGMPSAHGPTKSS